ncbi:SulP family inorganic anion transporter [Gluconobacter cerinus]|uniref:SulP family inorganic anion transporter n=1 Tax=Gluconobacter cerinus TaxID=38307 RepID=UPI001B8B65E8|nr:SulP family inorganic anion transporter [Gluconobacter cerinus]MBS1039241.1 SulP family inorganic anion transporter [Gluconobacter cerinus]MBS1046584.1 SulP family inorganic anion transporter [Gluconobacter cerinus]
MEPPWRRKLPPSWRTDVLAGLSLAFTNIPQVLGYARIAAMPSVTGLYTVLLPLVGFAAFGSSRHLLVAADSATAAILSGAITAMAAPGSAHYMALVSATALLAGMLLLAARLFRLGFLADFLSRTVLVGFMTGVGVQIAISMFHDMLGIQTTSHNPAMQAVETLTQAAHLNLTSTLTAGATVGGLLLLNRFFPRCPAALLAVVSAILADRTIPFLTRNLPTLGPIQSGLPTFQIPIISWNELLALFPVAASCVFVIITQSAATSRVYATQFDEELNENRDLTGLAAANILAAVSGTFTVNGSPTQTAMAVRAGARSQVAQVVFSLSTLIVLLFLTTPLQYLPQCVLAAIVFTVALGMIEIRALLSIRQESPGEFWLALVTAAVVVGAGVEQGVLTAIALSLFRHVRHSYDPHTAVLQPFTPQGTLEAVPARGGLESEPGLIIFRFCADLFYANSTRFNRDILTLLSDAPHPVRCILIECSPITDIDYSAANDLRLLLATLKQRQVTMIFGRVSQDLRADMNRHHLIAAIGPENIFEELHTALAAARRYTDATNHTPGSSAPTHTPL